jgi:hypothetical protein
MSCVRSTAPAAVAVPTVSTVDFAPAGQVGTRHREREVIFGWRSRGSRHSTRTAASAGERRPHPARLAASSCSVTVMTCRPGTWWVRLALKFTAVWLSVNAARRYGRRRRSGRGRRVGGWRVPASAKGAGTGAGEGAGAEGGGGFGVEPPPPPHAVMSAATSETPPRLAVRRGVFIQISPARSFFLGAAARCSRSLSRGICHQYYKL